MEVVSLSCHFRHGSEPCSTPHFLVDLFHTRETSSAYISFPYRLRAAFYVVLDNFEHSLTFFSKSIQLLFIFSLQWKKKRMRRLKKKRRKMRARAK